MYSLVNINKKRWKVTNWDNSPFQWPSSIANCEFARGNCGGNHMTQTYTWDLDNLSLGLHLWEMGWLRICDRAIQSRWLGPHKNQGWTHCPCFFSPPKQQHTIVILSLEHGLKCGSWKHQTNMIALFVRWNPSCC